MSRGTKAAGVAWLITAVYYFYQHTLRSAPAVMMPQLSEAFGLNAMGVASLADLFYWSYVSECPCGAIKMVPETI